MQIHVSVSGHSLHLNSYCMLGLRQFPPAPRPGLHAIQSALSQPGVLEECLNNEISCSDLPGHYHLTNYDGEYWHAPLNDIFCEGKISWEDLHGDFNIRIR